MQRSAATAGEMLPLWPNRVRAIIADLDLVIERNPKRAEAYLNRGLARAMKHDRHGSIADIERVLELNNDAEASDKAREILPSLRAWQ